MPSDKKVSKATGEIIPHVRSWRHPNVIKAQKFSKNIIQHHDFIYDTDKKCLVVVETEKEDREAYIQSFAAECGVYNILKKYARTGDASLLNQRQGFYGDISGLPTDELDPEKAKKAAEKTVKELSKALGQDISMDALMAMTSEDINNLIVKAVEAQKAKVQVEPEKIGGDK